MSNLPLLRLLIRAFVAAAVVAPACVAQPPDGDEFLKQYAETYRFTLGQPTAIQITDSGDAVLFLRSGPRSFVRDLYEFDVAVGNERLLAAASDLLKGEEEQLTAEELARRERMRSAARGIASFELSRDGRQILVPLSGSLFVIERATGKARELTSSAGYPIDARFSPDGKSIAVVRDGDLYVLDVASGNERRLTRGASETLSNGLAEFVAQEEMGRMHGYWWSPDSSQIVYQETDTSAVELLHIADPARPDQMPETWRYPRPGQENARVRLGIIPVVGGEMTWIEWDRERSPYVAAVTWEEYSPLTVLVQNREQTEEVLLAVDPASGTTTELLKETDPAWINLDSGMPRWLADGKHFLWTTERGGAWQLELRNRDGSLAQALTPPELGLRGLVGVDEQQATAFVVGGDDPTQSHLFAISLKPNGPPPRQITDEPGLHSATFAERSGTHVRAVMPLLGDVRHRVYHGDGRLAGELKSVAEQPPFAPSLELTIVGDEPRLHAAIVRPRTPRPIPVRDLERGSERASGHRYPVIVRVYGGPGSQTVRAASRSFLLDQWLADHGFIVVSIDGRGTPARGRNWERAIKGNFVELPLADQVRGLAALGEKYPELDLSRVGIFGWSFGGYMSAMAVMQRPDVFHAGIAGAPVVDFRDYDTHYTERYLGLPAQNKSGYDASSVLTYADKLQRPRLIIHGTADDNVYFLHSMKLCDALFRAGKPYDFLPLTGFTHMVPDPIVTQRLNARIAEFFTEHLKPGNHSTQCER
jgi:dipeptidyl-peptidase-4